MTEQRLREILERAEGGMPPPPPLPGDLGQRVRGRAVRRQMARRATLALATLIVASSTCWLITRRSPVDVAATSKTIIATPATSLAQLQMEGDLHQRVADAILRDRRQEVTAAQALVDPRLLLQQQVDDTARILVQSAELMAQRDQRDDAVENYRQVQRLFPDSSWAVVAAQHLRELHDAKAG